MTTAKHHKHRPLHARIKNNSILSKANKASLHFKKDVDQYVTKKPYQTLGIIMFAGVCLGYLIHRH